MFCTFYSVLWFHALVFTIWEIVKVMTFYSGHFRFFICFVPRHPAKIDREVRDVIIREFVSFITQGWGRKKMSQTNLTILASQLGFLEVLIIPGNCKRSPAPGAIWASEKSLRTSFLIWNQSGLHLLQELREQELMAVPGSSWVGLYRLRLSGRRVCSSSGGFSHSRWHVTRRYGVSNAASSLGCCVFDNSVGFFA